MWRKEALACPRGVTRSEAVPLPDDVDPALLGTDDCGHDDDCTGDHQICRLGFGFEDPCTGGDPDVLISVSRVCEQRCQRDSDCGEGQICMCDETGSGLNSCAYGVSPDSGGCVDDSDCADGRRCLGAWYAPRTNERGFRCKPLNQKGLPKMGRCSANATAPARSAEEPGGSVLTSPAR